MQALGSTNMLCCSLSSNPSLLLSLAAPVSYYAKSFNLSFFEAHSSINFNSNSPRWISDTFPGPMPDDKSRTSPPPTSQHSSSTATDFTTSNVPLSERLGLFCGHTLPRSHAAQAPHHTLDMSRPVTIDNVLLSTSIAYAPSFLKDRLPVQSIQELAEDAKLYATKAKLRIKGIGKKLLLRQVNKRIISRLARRATIGIPCLGFFLVSQVIVKDSKRVLEEMKVGNNLAASAFACAVVFETSDLIAQSLIISGLANANFGIGFAWLATYLAFADKWSLTSAALTCSVALMGELFALHDHHDHHNDQVNHEPAPLPMKESSPQS